MQHDLGLGPQAGEVDREPPGDLHLLEQHGGQVPRSREALEALPGVGRKTANVVLNVAFGGSLLQDINTQQPNSRRHVDGVLYDQLQHGLRFEPGSRLGRGCIVRAGGAVACTIREQIIGFRGLRERWWTCDRELPFPDWKTP